VFISVNEFSAPQIQFTLGEQTVTEEDQVTIAFTVSSEIGLSKVSLYKDDELYGSEITSFDDIMEFTFNEVVEISAMKHLNLELLPKIFNR
jgi:hypothetical protein